MEDSIDWAGLESDSSGLGRVDTVERVAQILRSRILRGSIPPGARLAEDSIGKALGVSRNTLREAFRLLAHDRLAVHRFNRGTFVREITLEDLTNLAQLRRMVECGVVLDLPKAPPESITPVLDALARAHTAAEAEDWKEVGVADLDFHRAITALAGNQRIDEVIERVLTEYRLAFVKMGDLRELHEPYLRRNEELGRLLESGDFNSAEAELRKYLTAAEEQLIAAYEGA